MSGSVTRVIPDPFDAVDAMRSFPVVTCAEMKALEKAADAAGLSYYQMMENAGTCAACFICEIIRKEAEGLALDCGQSESPICNNDPLSLPICDLSRVLIFCGKGNNGGDGLVVARVLSNQGFDVSVILVEGMPTTQDAMTNFALLPKEVAIKQGEDSLQCCIPQRKDGLAPPLTIMVDGIYGTGFHGTLRPEIAALINSINEYSDPLSKKLVFALDLPSGLSGDMGPSNGSIPNDFPNTENPFGTLCVAAGYTIAFHGLKPIHLNHAARSSMGQIVLADIGITDALK